MIKKLIDWLAPNECTKVDRSHETATRKKIEPEKSNAEVVAEAIAEQFKTGEVKADIDERGISNMITTWEGTTISLSWYSTGDYRGLTWCMGLQADELFAGGETEAAFEMYDRVLERCRSSAGFRHEAAAFYSTPVFSERYKRLGVYGSTIVLDLGSGSHGAPAQVCPRQV